MLKFLCLYFASNIIFNDYLKAHTIDSSIRELCFIQDIERVEICDMSYESLKDCGFVKTLKKAMKTTSREKLVGETKLNK